MRQPLTALLEHSISWRVYPTGIIWRVPIGAGEIAVTTFAIVAGVVGANLSSGIILVLGLANLLADGLSMAASNYSGTKSEVDDADRLREIEKKHIDQDPVGEREEIRQILKQKGLEGQVLNDATDAIIANEKVWIETMLVDVHRGFDQKRE